MYIHVLRSVGVWRYASSTARHSIVHVTLPNAFSLVSLQVEYLPSCRVADGLAMIEAFLPNVDEGGQFVPASDLRDVAVFGNHPMYSPKHTALQTTDLFNRIFL